jgi:hypothetical protein
VAIVGTIALVLVIAQGLLGAGRVIIAQDGESTQALAFAVVHAFTAQSFVLVILYLVSMLRGAPAGRGVDENLIGAESPARNVVLRLAQIGVLLIVGQTILGALARHFHYDWAVLAHVLNAIAVSFVGLSLATLLLIHSDRRRASALAFAIMGVLAMQLVLGGIAWYVTARFDRYDQTGLPLATLSVTAHVVLGAVLLALVWWTALHIGGRNRHRVDKHSAMTANGTPVKGWSA